MRKLLLSLILILLLAGQSVAANYYFDLASGNDITGDGTAGNPWKTIDKCTTSRSAGDECRGAKSTITTLTGTLTFTDGSTTVNTSADLSGVVAANDIVGKNSGLESWWHVASVTSSAITLTYQYSGISGSGSAVTGYKITPLAASEEYDINSSGSAGSPIKISGGWDLTGPTQDGITAFSTNQSNGIDFNSKNYIELSKFIIVQSSFYGLYINAAGDPKVSDLWVIHGSLNGIYVLNTSYRTILENVVISGGVGTAFNLSGGGAVLKSVYVFSVGTGSSDTSFSFDSPVVASDIRAYNSYAGSVSIGSGGSLSFITDSIFSGVRAGSNVLISDTSGVRFHSSTFSGASAYIGTAGIYISQDIYFINCTLTNGTSGRFNVTTQQISSLPTYIEQSSGADTVIYLGQAGTLTHDSTAAARSGKALKFAATSNRYPITYKVGTVKIPSAASDLTLNAYLKDDASFNGACYFFVVRNGKNISYTAKTPTTSYVKESVVIGTSDLVAGEYLDLYVWIYGTAGNVWIDDFSAEQ